MSGASKSTECAAENSSGGTTRKGVTRMRRGSTYVGTQINSQNTIYGRRINAETYMENSVVDYSYGRVISTNVNGGGSFSAGPQSGFTNSRGNSECWTDTDIEHLFWEFLRYKQQNAQKRLQQSGEPKDCSCSSECVDLDWQWH
ncbi:hypothetical protein HGRIS_005774 [Hohenbuehelia grisea]|uniref:Uncharacterized protein n=1 Tax=Hohenbuehelia grisea TaxID=104357 RepID=A0ABR3K053_9AGAR